MFPFKSSSTPSEVRPAVITDGELLRRAAVGQQDAFAKLYQRYAGRMYAYLLPRAGNDAELAEDLRQQVFLQLLESKAFVAAKKGMVRDDLSSLIFSIAANLLKNTYRSSERRRNREETYQQLQNFKVPDSVVCLPKERIDWGLTQLPEDQRNCIQLRFQSGLSIKEIAERSSIPVGTVKSRLHYGLLKLRELLAEDLKQ